MNGYLIRVGGSPMALLSTEDAVLDWMVANEEDSDVNSNVTVTEFARGVPVRICIGLRPWSPLMWRPEANWENRYTYSKLEKS